VRTHTYNIKKIQERINENIRVPGEDDVMGIEIHAPQSKKQKETTQVAIPVADHDNVFRGKAHFTEAHRGHRPRVRSLTDLTTALQYSPSVMDRIFDARKTICMSGLFIAIFVGVFLVFAAPMLR
jgi:hypothetical protein